MMQFSGMSFVRQEVRLDFMNYERCVFEDCVMVFSGYGTLSVTNCVFRNVQWVFSDAASNTIQFMRALYHNNEGGKEAIEPFLKIITQNGGREGKQSIDSGITPLVAGSMVLKP